VGLPLRDGLKHMQHGTIYASTNEELTAGITTYGVEGMSGPDLQKYLWEKERLQPRSVGEKMIRHSVHIYNSKDEIDRALNLISGLA
ncbi:MAG: hypothetical protein VXW38_06290, partial [Bacteroidota bacterium]|nr:hypothetical protein [Bacteroidota bacterium]